MADDRIQGISGAGIAALFVGGVFAYAAVKGFSISQTAQSIISGKNPQNLQGTNSVTANGLLSGVFSGVPIIGGLLGNSGGGSSGGNVQSTGGAVAQSNSANKALGQRMASAVGWGSGAQWTALNNIVMAESGWSSTIKNPTSTASGIAQNIRGFGPGYESGNAPQQIAWLLNYIKNTYQTPEQAWAFHLAHGWY
jgi:hypothetical protein